MGRTLTLFTYKLQFFFGPAFRGRFGPIAYLALILVFLPSARGSTSSPTSSSSSSACSAPADSPRASRRSRWPSRWGNPSTPQSRSSAYS